MNGFDAETVQRTLLPSVLTNVVFDGWTDRALRCGAEAAGYSRADVPRLFPGGVPGAVAMFSAWADQEMEASLQAHDLAPLAVRERVALAIQSRLSVLVPHREAVRHSLIFLSLPPNLALGSRLLFQTVDRIWYAVGDTSTDFRWYTKRGTLAAVIGATTLYWLQDSSEGSVDTAAFLDRRLSGVIRAGTSVNSIVHLGNLLSFVPSPRRFARQLRRQAESL